MNNEEYLTYGYNVEYTNQIYSKEIFNKVTNLEKPNEDLEILEMNKTTVDLEKLNKAKHDIPLYKKFIREYLSNSTDQFLNEDIINKIEENYNNRLDYQEKVYEVAYYQGEYEKTQDTSWLAKKRKSMNEAEDILNNRKFYDLSTLRRENFEKWEVENIDTLEEKIKLKKENISKEIGSIDEIKAKNEELENKIEEKEREIEEKQWEVESAKSELEWFEQNNPIDDEEEKVKEYEKKKEEFKTKIKEKEKKLKTLKENLKKLKDDLKLEKIEEIKDLGENSIALGAESLVNAKNSIAMGYKNQVSGNYSGAFGDSNKIYAKNSYMIGNNNKVGTKEKTQEKVFILGSNVDASSVSNAVVLGDSSTAVENSVSVGSKDNERQIKFVKAGTDDTDAVNYGQLKNELKKVNCGSDVKVDLTDYYKKSETYNKEEVNQKLEKKANVSDVYTKKETDKKLKSKVEKKYVDTELSKKVDDLTYQKDKKVMGENVKRIENNTEAINKLERRVDKLDKGLATAAALSGLQHVDIKTNEYSIAANVGGYNGNQAVAVGVRISPKENLYLNGAVSMSTNSKQNTMYSAGFTYKGSFK